MGSKCLAHIYQWDTRNMCYVFTGVCMCIYLSESLFRLYDADDHEEVD